MEHADKLTRFSVSMESGLARRFDEMVKTKGGVNRSQAITQLVKTALIEHYAAEESYEIAGSITLIYDHHQRQIQETLTSIQHDSGDLIISAMHVHLDHHNCMEILAVRGPVGAVKQMSDQLIATHGVKHGRLNVTTTGKEFTK